MDTKEKTRRYIILIPHKEVLKSLEKYRQKLFSMGYCGAYSFPLCAPLAVISRPYSCEELKELAGNIRKLSMENNGNILTGKNTVIGFTDELSFFGPELILNIEKISFTPTVICAALVKDDIYNPEQAPVISFRAAYLANLAIRPIRPPGEAELSFEWRISLPVWLPSYRKKQLHF